MILRSPEASGKPLLGKACDVVAGAEDVAVGVRKPMTGQM